MITFNDLPKVVNQLYIESTQIKETLEDLKKKLEPQKPTEYLTAEEVANLLKCDLSTIYNWRKKGILFTYGIGNRILFKRSDIDAKVIPLSKNKNVVK